MQITLNANSAGEFVMSDQFKRIVHADDAFLLLWDIDQLIYRFFNDENNDDVNDACALIGTISNYISDSKLLDLYR